MIINFSYLCKIKSFMLFFIYSNVIANTILSPVIWTQTDKESK